MGDALTIRRYRATDHAAVWALHHVAERADAPDRIPPVVADDPAYGDVHRIEDTDLRQGGELLVGVLDDQLVAISGIERVDPERAYVKRGRVHHAHHGRRFGRALMRALEKRARALSYRVLEPTPLSIAARRDNSI